jgi:thymidine kinase
LFLDILAHVVGWETTKDVWSKITKMFSTQSMSKVKHLCGALNSTKKGSLTDAHYFDEMKGFSSELVALGKEVAEGERVGYILNGLDHTYNNVVAAVHGNPGTTLDDLYD